MNRDVSAVITVTDVSAKKMAQLIASRDEDTMGIRISVDYSGCGSTYRLSYVARNSADHDENGSKSEDIVVKTHGLSIYLDPAALMFVKGMEIDYKDSLEKSGFVFNNPQAKKVCHCGRAFRTGSPRAPAAS